MTAATLPLPRLLLTVSGWGQRPQQDGIASLVEENRGLNEPRGGRKLRLPDGQRRRLAATARLLGRRALDAVATRVTPDTLLRWHRRLIAWKWTDVVRRVGWPGLRQASSDLMVRRARENDRWGDGRIQGELRTLWYRVATSTIGTVLKDHGRRPAPGRPTSWRTFLRAQWGEGAGRDFFTTDVWTPLGFTTDDRLFLIDLKTCDGRLTWTFCRKTGTADSEREILDDVWPDLFAAMLHCWLTDEQQWPTNRTHQMGGEGFDLQRCPVVEDLHVDAALVELD